MTDGAAAGAEGFARRLAATSFVETAAFAETYGFSGSQGEVALDGQRLLPETASDTVLIFMHPASVLHRMPMPAALTRAGHHVLCAASRFARNDTALIMEKVAADLGAWVRHARDDLGYERVILAGWSGGGALCAFYQAEAEDPRVRATPAGDAFDLAAADLPPADGLMMVAAHTGRARLLAEWIDPSVTDEADPEARDPALDLYGGRVAPPYDAAFVERYREAQRARVARITERAEATLAHLRAAGGAEAERPFVTHRTMADPRFLDPTLEPNGRTPGTCYMGVPEAVNAGPVGLARFATLRAWMSQWSARSVADAELCLPRVSAPTLIVENGADDAVPPSHMAALRAAAPGARAETIAGATHYYQGQPALAARAVDLVGDWIDGLGNV